jgi:hypothetical protein
MSLIREQAEERINTFGSIYAMSFGKKYYRFVWQIIAEHSRKGKILIPAYGDQFYTDVELLPIEDVERYAQSQINHIKNQYRNKVRPLKKYIKDEQLKKLMGTLDTLEEE